MILADLQTVEKAIPRLEKEARGRKELKANLDATKEAMEALEAGTPIIATKIDRDLIRELSLLTAKPYIYVFNCDADELGDEDLKQQMRDIVAPAEAIFLDAKFESELVELGDEERPARCWPRWASTSRASTCWRGSGSTPSGCRPT